MKILSVEQIREADRVTIAREPVASIELMERAAKGISDQLTDVFTTDMPFSIYCGMGNNGGDGLAIARHLREQGYEVRVVVVRYTEKASPDLQANLKRLNDFEEWTPNKHPAPDRLNTVRIDALLGSGLTRPLDGFLAEVVADLNADPRFTVAVDLPTGVFADDNRANDLSRALRADMTFTFQWPKRALLMPDSGPLCGVFEVIDIGLDADYAESAKTAHYFVDEHWAQLRYGDRSRFSHKGHFGHALIAAGARGNMGAAVMCARSCMRSGVGLLTGHVPGSAEHIWPQAIPEAMAKFDPMSEHLTDHPDLNGYSAIGIGPGIGQHEDTAHLLHNFILHAKASLILDADALNILAGNKTWLSFCQQVPILTPHPGEFSRLSEVKPGPDQYDAAIDFARKYQCVVVLKGTYTATVLPNGDTYFNSTGHSGLATGGSGDVLTGLITGLRAQGYGVAEAAILGSYIHGRAAELALNDQSEESLIASDLPEHFGGVFDELKA